VSKEHENGINSGARNFGRLCLALILLALGLGASVWFGIYVGVHQFQHTLSQEERAAVAVGAAVRPEAPIAVALVKRDCTEVTRADLDGSALVILARNGCHDTLSYFEWHWELLSPTGVVLKSGYRNYQCPIPNVGETAECRFESIPTDDRAASARVWTRKSAS
jgi:hypothetical protein